MKFKLNILALGLFSLGLASCTDSFLDVESKTESSTGNYYKTESDAYRALVGCYDGWQCTTSSEGGGLLSGFGDDGGRMLWCHGSCRRTQLPGD